jgi:hypothetical protein
MRTSAVAIRSRKRRPLTRRDRRGDPRRRSGRRPVWVGSRAKASAFGPLFLALRAQQVKRSPVADWLGAGAMLLGVASWAVLAAVLAA